MEIFPSTPLRNAGTDAPDTSARSTLTADFQTLLRLLTAQMENQDPLNSMESTEFATQLATFSGVEQQVRTNELLSELQAGFGTLGMGEMSGWIGMEARVETPVALNGAPVMVQAAPNPLADRAELVARDATGEIVQRLPVPLSDDPFDWDGTALDGTVLPEGSYDLSLESWQGETLLDARPMRLLAEVEEAQVIDGAVWLTLDGGMRVPAHAVIGLREPAS